MSSLVTGLFPSRASAEHGVDELVRAGFSRNDMSLDDVGSDARP